VLRDPSDQGLVWQCKTLVQESDRHHSGSDHEAVVDGSLGQQGIKTMCPLYSDHRMADDWEYPTGEDMVDALNIVAEVAHLEATLSI
jgi:hypothetical protein